MCYGVPNVGGSDSYTINVDGNTFRPVSIIKTRYDVFKVKVGCKTVIFSSWAAASKAIEEYWADPKEAELKYSKIVQLEETKV